MTCTEVECHFMEDQNKFVDICQVRKAIAAVLPMKLLQKRFILNQCNYVGCVNIQYKVQRCAEGCMPYSAKVI